MAEAFASWHAGTGRPLVNPAIATAGVAACLGLSSPELALIAETDLGAVAALPCAVSVGYAVDAASGEIHGPGRAWPAGRRMLASLRVSLPVAGAMDEAVLKTLAALSGNGWAIRVQPTLAVLLDRSLATVKARPEDLRSLADAAAAVPAALDGRGVLLGVVDFGCDFAHPAFRTEGGGSRLELLWDQNEPGAAGAAVPGQVYGRAEIDAALAQEDPYAALGYWPDRNGYGPPPGDPSAIVHGTHVLGVAGGRGVAGCPAGTAPGVLLAFVHLRPGALVSNGDPADVFDGVCAIFERAEALGVPAVVNLSLGANSGSHDGNSLLDCALDALLVRAGRAITVAAGNGREGKLNMDGVVAADVPLRLGWCFGAGDACQNTLRIFAEAPGAVERLSCSVTLAGVGLSVPMADGANTQLLRRDGVVCGVLYSDLTVSRGAEPVQQIEIRFQPTGRPEVLEVTLAVEGDRPVAFDAWIDRDDRDSTSQSTFDVAPAVTRSTLASTACGHRTVCVGAFSHLVNGLPAAAFSAEGTTRDGRLKPDVSAPGLGVLAASAYGGRTLPGQVWQSPLARRMSGSSVAAPHVAGTLALMLQVRPGLSAEEALATLRRSAQADGTVAPPGWHPQLGFGRMDATAAVREVLV